MVSTVIILSLLIQAQMMSILFPANSGQVAPQMGAFGQNGLQNLGPRHDSDSMDAGMLSLANGAPEDVQPEEMSEDVPQKQALANQNGEDFPLEVR